MDDILRALMDAQTALQRVQVLLEGREENGADGPIMVKNGQAQNYYCRECMKYIGYGDKYCRECGARIKWG